MEVHEVRSARTAGVMEECLRDTEFQTTQKPALLLLLQCSRGK